MLLALHPLMARAGTRIIDSVEIESQAEESRIHIQFNIPLQYVTHTPAGKGNVLQILLKPVPGSDINMDDLITHETLRWKPSSSVPLFEISYEEGTPGGVNLIFRFSETVTFRVLSGSDLMSLVITIPMEMTDKPPSSPLNKSEGTGIEVQQPSSPPTADDKEEADLQKGAPSTAETPPAAGTSYYYAINLISSLEPIDPLTLDKSGIPVNYRLYTSRFDKQGKTWHRLRLGFFPSQQAAEQVMDSLKPRFPDAWVTRVDGTSARRILPSLNAGSPAEAAAEPGALNQTGPALQDKPGVKKPAAPVDQAVGDKMSLTPADQEMQPLMDEAKVAMTAGDLQRAIQLYTKILQVSGHRFLQEAQELMGLARERNGQLAHAKAEYDKYLQLYPKGEGAERVRQRLAGFLTAREKPQEKLRQARKTKEESGWEKDFYGSFSQFYNRDESYTDLADKTVNQSALSSDLNVNTRMRSDHYDIRSMFIGGYDKDFLDETDDNSRLSAFYIDALDRERHLSGRIGRQSGSRGGVLGRFDGGLLSYQPFSPLTVNAVSGFPVQSSSIMSIESDKHFNGLSLELGPLADHWNFNTFIIDQKVNGITDRQALGGEVRYFDPYRSFFSLMDYDISYQALNILIATGNWTLPDKTTLTMSLDSRKSPILTTSNALQGQEGVESIADLLKTFSEDEVRALAEDRTATLRTYTLGLSRPLHEKLLISGDATLSKMSSTKASGGVEAVPGTGTESRYSIQLIGSSLIKEGDIAIIGMSYADASTSNTTSMNLNTRYPLGREWRINPRFRVDYRQNKENNDEQLKIRPSFRTEYRFKKRYHFELEAGYEWATDKFSETNEEEKTRGYFWTAGYRIDF